MKLEDFGYDPKTKIHNPKLTDAETRFLGLLWVDHTGAENKISAENLAVMYDYALDGHTLSLKQAQEIVASMKRLESQNKALEYQKRIVRLMSSHLLDKHENTGVISQAGIGGGYFIAENEEEIEQYCKSFKSRGLHGIKKASRASRTRFAKVMTQIAFEFEDLVDLDPATGIRDQGLSDREPAPYVLVDALLESMMKDPEKFSKDLQKLGRKFGSVMLPKARYVEIKSHTQRLQELMAELES